MDPRGLDKSERTAEVVARLMGFGDVAATIGRAVQMRDEEDRRAALVAELLDLWAAR